MTISDATTSVKRHSRVLTAWRVLIATAAVTAATAAAASAASPITLYPPFASDDALDIAAGPGGNIWVTLEGRFAAGSYPGSGVGYLSPDGQLHGPFPTTDTSYPYAITSGPDGNMWFTVPLSGAIGKVTTAGAITQFHPGMNPKCSQKRAA
jgi:streptogramin lyase